MATESQDSSTRSWIAGEIRAELGRRGLTHRQLADALGWSRQHLSKRMCGESDWRVSELLRVAQILDVPVTKFLPIAAMALVA